MKIFADFYYYNNKNENIFYDSNTKLSLIIKDSENFISLVDKNINLQSLVIKWSELYEILNKNGDIPLFKLLRIQKKFKICYGGYIKFRIIYNNKECLTIFQSSNNKNEINNHNINKLLSVYDTILKYLTNEEKFNFSLINKSFYKEFLDNKIFKKDIYFKNSCHDEEEEQNKLINFKKIFGGHNMGLYEVKKLGMYIGEKYIYLLVQSIETYNVEIMRLNKSDLKEHEIIFRDNWTNYYMFENTIYQLKYTKEKTKLNKIDKNDEINFIYINVSNFGDEFDSEYFYYYNEIKEIFIVTSELKIYKYNKSKKKLKLFFDESKKLKKFNNFASLCKVRNSVKYYKFIKNLFFLSLIKFHIFDITNKKLIMSYPEIRGVDFVMKINRYFYINDYRYIYLLSDKDFEINYKFKKYNSDFCFNSLLRIDPFLNHMQTSLNDYIETSNDNSLGNKIWMKKTKLGNIFFKFSDKYLCSDYYNDKEALYIKLYEINVMNKNCIESIKKIRINANKFIKRLKFEGNIKEKMKKEIINNIRCHIFFNGLGDFIINMNEYLWIYHYIDEVKETNNINSFKQNKDKPLYKYNNIIIKSNDIIKYNNIVFYDKTLIIWKPKSLKILYYNLNNQNNIENNSNIISNESKIKFNNNVKILSLKDLNLEIDYPIFIFHSYLRLYLITNLDEDNNSYDLYEIKIENGQIKLMDKLLIEFDNDESVQNDETFIYAKFIFKEKYLVIFSSNALYIFKRDESKMNLYKLKKRKEHNIIGYFTVKELIEEETCFITQDNRTKDCLFFDVMPWIQE